MEIDILEILRASTYGYGINEVMIKLIQNSWDADSTIVSVKFPSNDVLNPHDTIIIEDNGRGMTPEEMSNLFRMFKGSNQKSSSFGRERSGTFGIGFWSWFAIANHAKIITIKNGTKAIAYIDLEKNQNAILSQGFTYTTSDTSETNGTRIELTSLKIEQVSKSTLIENLILYFKLALGAMSIIIDGTPLCISESDLIEDFIDESQITNFAKEVIHTNLGDHTIQWRIRFTKDVIPNPELRGISVYSKSHLIQKPHFFKSRETYANPIITQYIAGEIIADYLNNHPCVIKQPGNIRVDWTHEDAVPLYDFIQNKIDEYTVKKSELLVTVKLENLFSQYPNLKLRFDSFDAPHRERILLAIRAILSAHELKPQKAEGIILTLLDAMDSLKQHNWNTYSELLNITSIFSEKDLMTVINNLANKNKAIDVLEKYVKENATENPIIHTHIKNNPWLLGFNYRNFEHEQTRETFLKTHFGIIVHDKKRIDTIAFSNDGTLLIVELKRPSVKAGEKELRQIADYVDFIRTELGSSKKTGIDRVEGILIVGRISTSKRKLESERNRLENDQIYVLTWNDVISNIRKALQTLIAS